MARRNPLPRPGASCVAASLLAASLFVFAAPAAAGQLSSQEFIQVWRRPTKAAPATAPAANITATAPAPTALPSTPPPAAAPAQTPTALSADKAKTEARLALKAFKDEQNRLVAESSARSQASLAATAAANENLRLAEQVPAPKATAPLTPPPQALALRLPRTADNTRPAARTMASKRAGLLEEMLDHADTQQTGAEPSEAELKHMLADAVRHAAEHTPQMRQYYAEYLASEADVDQAKGQRWPQLSLSGQSHQHRFGTTRDAPANTDNQVKLNMTTTLFDWGQMRKTIDSRKQLASANNERYQAQLENLAYQVINTMLELARQRNMAQLYQHYVDRMTRLARMLEEIVQVDRGRASELTQAKARLLQAQTSHDAAVAKARDAELALQKLIGDEPAAMPEGTRWPIAPADATRLLTALEEHPAIRQAIAQARAADLTTEATRAAGRPKLNWVVTGGTGRDEVGLRQPLATMLTMSWPIFSGGSQRAAVAAARYRAEAQRENAEQQRLDYAYELRTADQDAQVAFRRADDYGRLSSETDRIRRGFFEQWYQLGQRTLLDVLSAESDYYNNRIGEVSSRFDAYQAVMREYASAGELVRWLRVDRPR